MEHGRKVFKTSKCWYQSINQHGIISQKIVIFINNAVNAPYHTMKMFNDCEKNIKTHLSFKNERYS